MNGNLSTTIEEGEPEPFDGLPTPKNVAAWAASDPVMVPVGDKAVIRAMLTRMSRRPRPAIVTEGRPEGMPLLGGDAELAYLDIYRRKTDLLIAILISPDDAPMLAFLAQVGDKITHLHFKVGSDFAWRKSALDEDAKQAMLLAWFGIQQQAKIFLKTNGLEDY